VIYSLSISTLFAEADLHVADHGARTSVRQEIVFRLAARRQLGAEEHGEIGQRVGSGRKGPERCRRPTAE